MKELNNLLFYKLPSGLARHGHKADLINKIKFYVEETRKVSWFSKPTFVNYVYFK